MTERLSTAVILAGGKGTRMGAVSELTPKPLLPVLGRSVLGRQTDWLKREGIRKVVVLVSHLAEQFVVFAKQETTPNFQIEIVTELSPLGTGGALSQLSDRLKEDFLCIYGDLVLDLNIEALTRFHRRKNADLTLVVHPNDHPYDSDLVEADGNQRVTGFLTKPHSPNITYRNLVNAAVYVMTPQLLQAIPKQKHDLARDSFPELAKTFRVFAYSTPEYLKDMGTPERRASVEKALIENRVARQNLQFARHAVFLDRDGVICNWVDNLHREEDFSLCEGVAQSIRQLNQAGFLTIVVTNQPMIAKGMLTEERLQRIHRVMETQLGQEGAWIDRIYYCPHHPEKGFAGEVDRFKIDCDCRKPKSGMLEQASAEFKIERARSWLIGDSWSDIAAGYDFGVRTIGIQSRFLHSHPDAPRADFEVNSLSAGVARILKNLP